MTDEAMMPADRWPATKIEMWQIADLVPYAKNARTHPPEQIDQIAASMERFGFTIPMLVAEDGTIIAGHGRLMAAAQLGMAEVPVMVARGWSEEDRRLYTLADNRLAETSEWDPATLQIEVEELKGLGVEDDLSMIGFSEGDLKDILPAALLEVTGGLTDPDDVPEADEDQPVAQPGDIWVLGDHRIVCGSSTDASTVDELLASAKPHLMVTDPPYGVEYDPGWREHAGVAGGDYAKGKVLNDDNADWREAWALFPGDVAYVWHAGLFAGVVGESLIASKFKLRSQIIWDKGQLVLSRGDYHWQHEPCWYAVREGKTGHWAGDRKQVTVWQIEKPRKSETGHGTQKPVDCMRIPIENNSAAGDAVYEPFSGSGTTIIAAEMTGRRCYAVELNPAYVDVAVRRWEEFTGREAVLEHSNQTFADTMAARLGSGPEETAA
ncbi:site-specific DNA-methyltransferase [Roseovarius sp. SYSU LYC5161]|uniref:site-specific DNA-methyltransferase n=1 Tax=Roseovarius halophilus (ex Wu et al. 2025) TaxID=3376060 RepID=UPI00399C3504